MINLFIRKITKDKDASDAEVRSKLASFASGVGISLNVLLFIAKLTIGLLAASVAIIADALNNITDAGSVVIALIGFRMAAKPVDKEHPQGHGRMEYVAGFIVDMVILFVGFELFKSSLEKIINPTLPSVTLTTLIVLIGAIFIKLWLFFFYRRMGIAVQSTALKAASLDSLSDCAATSLVLLSAIVGKYAGVAIDGWAGIFVAAFIFYTGLKAAKETIDLLLGGPADPEFIQDIYGFCKNYPRIVGIHDVMVHDYGVGRKIVSFHAEVPSDSDINIAHEEVDALERDMHAAFGCIVTVHLDPLVVNDPLVNELRALAETTAKQMDERYSLHDFRMTKGETKINLIFDLLLPVGVNGQTAATELAQRIQALRPECSCVIRPEHPYV